MENTFHVIDPRIEKAYRNVAARLRDSNGNPPSDERINWMLKKFKRLRSKDKPDDVAYVESIGRGWRAPNVKTETQ